MKGRVIAVVCIFCVAGFIGLTADAKKPPTAECIIFTGDLASAGETQIVGCCPNAGPWPDYRMTLTTGTQLDGTFDGQLFINYFGTGANQLYKVQFWTWDFDHETPGDGDFFFEIKGGDIDRDRRAKTLTVTFTEEMATGWKYYDGGGSTPFDIPNVSFVLLRTSNLDYCP
jgi:hypothetical protein